MKWITDPSVGAWLGERLDTEWGATMHTVVPRGFAAYARVFHPVRRDRPVDDEWPPLPYARHRREWKAFQRRDPEIIDEQVTWAQTAAAMGTTMHSVAQWADLIAPGVIVENEDGPRDSLGWQYGVPALGNLVPEQFAAVAGHLVAHTSSDAGFAALWEGWGGLLTVDGRAAGRTFLTFDDNAHHQEMLARSSNDAFNNVFRAPVTVEGILSAEISDGPRLSLPGREYILFSASVRAFADPDWVLRAPWRDLPGEAHGFAPSAQSPNIFWPEDRAWTLVSEIDLDSTIIAGSSELVAAVCADERLEAMQLSEGTHLF